MPFISIQNLSKAFHHHTVLKNINFSVEQGEIVALLGQSGSGKTTLLRCLNLLENADQGLVTIKQFTLDFTKATEQQQPVLPKQALQALRCSVGMIFQQFNCWPHMTILENLMLAPLKVLKKSKAVCIQEAESLLEKMGLFEKRDAYPNSLSGGQKQRVAIARALMMHPDVLLFDEPTSALDPETTRSLGNIIQKLASDGMTIIMATHDVNFVKQVATKLLFLDQGTLLEQGEATAVLANPQTQRFKQFLATEQHLVEEEVI